MKKLEIQDIKIVPFDESYARASIPWLAQLYPNLTEDQEPALIQHINNLVSGPNNELFGIEIDGKPGAVVGVLEQNPLEESCSLMVISAPKYQNKGLGRPVLAWLIDQVLRGRFKKVRAFCRSKGVVNMLRKVGFQKTTLPGTLMEYSYE